jgi:hypothetical protein
VEEIPAEEPPPPIRAAAPAATAAVAPPAPTVTGAPLGSTASFDAPSPASTSEPSPTLSEEVSALDAARRELTSGRARAALAAIDAYRARFPTGSLRTEATVLRVEALLGSGDRAGAEREANAIVRAAPGSRHAARVLDLLAR